MEFTKQNNSWIYIFILRISYYQMNHELNFIVMSEDDAGLTNVRVQS